MINGTVWFKIGRLAVGKVKLDGTAERDDKQFTMTGRGIIFYWLTPVKVRA